MNEIEILSRTQKINVYSIAQRIVVDKDRIVKVKSAGSQFKIVSSGPPGPPGVIGPQGPQGPAGQDATLTSVTYVHDQGTPDTIWNVDHGLGFYPAVTIVDSGGNEVEGHVTYVSVNTLYITFTLPFGGKAFLS